MHPKPLLSIVTSLRVFSYTYGEKKNPPWENQATRGRSASYHDVTIP